MGVEFASGDQLSQSIARRELERHASAVFLIGPVRALDFAAKNQGR